MHYAATLKPVEDAEIGTDPELAGQPSASLSRRALAQEIVAWEAAGQELALSAGKGDARR
jgi:hypothetical protein